VKLKPKEDTMKIKALYTSIWDDETRLTSNCVVNMDTGEYEVLESYEIEGVDLLTDEFVTLPDGRRLEVENDRVILSSEKASE